MSFLTEYFDEYRLHPIRKTKICRPEARWAHLEGKWLDPKKGTQDGGQTEEEIKAFIKDAMVGLRGRSTYGNHYCEHLDPIFKTREFKPRPKQKVLKSANQQVQEEAPKPLAKLAIKDTEVMKCAKALYERDMNQPTLEPLKTHFRLYGYVRPSNWRTGISDYQAGIAQLAYVMIRDDLLPKYVARNGERPRWGLPPEAERQPELDGIPLDGERLY